MAGPGQRWPQVLRTACLAIFVFAFVTYQSRVRAPTAVKEAPSEWLLPPPPADDAELAAALFRYIEEPQRCCRRLNLFGGKSNANHVDGDKFVCLDRGVAPPPGSCLVYSVGISNEWSFDRDITAYGCQVYAFDPSMTSYNRNVTEFGARFYKIGLGGKTGKGKKGWNMMTLTDMRAMLGHSRSPIHYLKVDIEGSEWDWLDNDMEGLDEVLQFGMEVHMNPKTLRRHYDVFRRLQEAGFRTIHSNPNRVSGRRFSINGVAEKVGHLYELVWVRA